MHIDHFRDLARARSRSSGHTKGVPQDQGELGDLFSLLAEFQKGLLTGVLVQQIGNVGHGAAVILGHVGVVGSRVLMDSIEGIGMTGRGCDPVEVSLLGGGGGSSSLLGMVLMALLMHPGGGFLGIVMLAVHGVVGHHLDALGTARKSEPILSAFCSSVDLGVRGADADFCRHVVRGHRKGGSRSGGLSLVSLE